MRAEQQECSAVVRGDTMGSLAENAGYEAGRDGMNSGYVLEGRCGTTKG